MSRVRGDNLSRSPPGEARSRNGWRVEANPIAMTQGMDGLLGVAGMMTLLVMTGIIPENSLCKNAPVSKFIRTYVVMFMYVYMYLH